MTEQLDSKQLGIIDRAASRIRKENREAFRKYVLDIVRGQSSPTNTTVRWACGAGIVRYGRKI